MQVAKASANLTQSESRKIINNNSSNVKNKNQKILSQDAAKSQTSQNKIVINDAKDDSLIDDPGETKVKQEETNVETE